MDSMHEASIRGATRPYRVHSLSFRSGVGRRSAQNSSAARAAFATAVSHIAASAKEPLVIGIRLGHDTSFAVTRGGKALGVVELERLHRSRYFVFRNILDRDFGPEWEKLPDHALDEILDTAMTKYVHPALTQLCEMVCGSGAVHERDGIQTARCELQYDAAVVADPWTTPDAYQRALRRAINASEWLAVDHHLAHASLGWLDSPFYHGADDATTNKPTLILSYDGFGNDGSLRTFLGFPGRARLSALGRDKGDMSLGMMYSYASVLPRDLAWGSPYGSKQPCSTTFECRLRYPGAFMAFAALAAARVEWKRGAKMFLNRGLWHEALWPSPHGGVCRLETSVPTASMMLTADGKPLHPSRWPVSPYTFNLPRYFSCEGADQNDARELDRNFAATIQEAFEELVEAEVRMRLRQLELEGQHSASLVITGGCALNVKVNSALARNLNLPVHVPAAPGDNGLALGAAWLLSPPPATPDAPSSQFLGAPLTFRGKQIDSEQLESIALRWGASMLPNIEYLAKLLLTGAIVGVARGRAEFGPRSLGHRSLLASAAEGRQKERLNRLKHRKWYRPCAPIVAAEDLVRIFEPGLDLVFGSPYMSIAPPLKPWVAERFPALAHLDGTARPQTVRSKDDPWMYSLLVAIRSAMEEQLALANCSSEESCVALGVLINTSLNPKGMPIAADIDDILAMFCTPGGEELDFVLVEERWLFERSTTVLHGGCSRAGGAGFGPREELPTI